jgi:hypothetical protein
MVISGSIETSAYSNQTARHHIKENNVYCRRHENFKLQIISLRNTTMMMMMMMMMFIMIMNIAVMRINNCFNSRAGSVKYYSLQPLLDVPLSTNDENLEAYQGTFEQADERFFYIKASGSNVAFKAIHNGSEYINSIKALYFQ